MVMILYGLEHFGVPVRRFHEGLPFTFQHPVRSSRGGIDEGDYLESRSELVLETEGVARKSISQPSHLKLNHSLPSSLIRTEHNVL